MVEDNHAHQTQFTILAIFQYGLFTHFLNENWFYTAFFSLFFFYWPSWAGTRAQLAEVATCCWAILSKMPLQHQALPQVESIKQKKVKNLVKLSL